MEVDVQLAADKRIVEFLVGDRDSEPDVEPLGLGSAAIGCFHDPRSAAGAHDEASADVAEFLGPVRQAMGERARRLVVVGKLKHGLRGSAVSAGPLRPCLSFPTTTR